MKIDIRNVVGAAVVIAVAFVAGATTVSAQSSVTPLEFPIVVTLPNSCSVGQVVVLSTLTSPGDKKTGEKPTHSYQFRFCRSTTPQTKSNPVSPWGPLDPG